MEVLKSRKDNQGHCYRVLIAVAVWLLLCVGSTRVLAAGPAYQVLRQDEDWSVLSSPAGGAADRFDPVKYVPINAAGSAWLSLGGQLRERYEGWSSFNFGSAPAGVGSSDDFLISRVLLHADLHLGRSFRVFVQGKSALSTSRDLPGGRRTLEVDEADFQNAFVELARPLGGGGQLRLRGGRQEFLFGKQRLVSPLDWSNTRRTFDGISAIVDFAGWKATAFYSRLVRIKKYDLNTGNKGIELYGLYATRALESIPGVKGIDLYWLALDRRSVTFNSSSGQEDRHTVGGRLWGGVPGTLLDYDLEGAYQFGDIGSADINAFMIASQLGASFGRLLLKPRLEVGFDYASGDDDPNDGSVGTFNQLFPLGHAWLGYIDTVGRQNVVDLRGTAFFTPVGSLRAKLDLHSFWRADSADALYNAGGGVVRGGSLGSSNDVGMEFDFTVKQPLDRHTLVLGGYGHFFAGEFIDQAGPSKDIDFVYMTVQYTF